jgi:hypothetical protein
MKYFRNDTGSFYYDETVFPSVINVLNLAKEYPSVLRPFRGKNEKVGEILASAGFMLYPTVKKTGLFYESSTDCFFKILYPLTLKYKIYSFFSNKARSVYLLSLNLLSNRIRVPDITAYGMFRKGRIPFFVMKRVDGKSLYDTLVKENGVLSRETYLHIIDEVARFHLLGFWFADAHLSHILMRDRGVSGFIDIDSMRKNRPFRFKNLAKDLAGLNHPKLPLSENGKKELLHFYMDRLNISNREKFLQMIKFYTKRRWS